MTDPKTFEPTQQDLDAMKDKLFQQLHQEESFRQEAQEKGVPILKRLFEVAKSDTGQSLLVRKFLLGCYDGQRFPFDLTNFRQLDLNLFQDCMAILAMDRSPSREVHEYLDGPDYKGLVNGGELFEQWAKTI
ncbi:hypothetical protein GHT89_16480 [Acinetobacter baumannii]|uniref:DUF7673 family protein n=1 Tax=Acinetobacter baumannii TaxID=470 RepID=UPI00387DD489